MKCKSCGGELLFQNGIYLCESCGATFALDGIYENIDVCICYEENDTTGRRTRDSIIAQEVYRKLEESKVATFYQRVSADTMTGDDLETVKLTAIRKAKIVIVLGTSVENFTALESKYSEHFSGKPVIPFCVDINPGDIPKTLSKIQAMSYSTIGWDKDLIKGICNILGREEPVATGALYGKRKVKIIIIGAIAVVVAIAVAITVWILSKPKDLTEDLETDAFLTEEISETTTKTLSQKEIYDNAMELFDQGNYVESMELFLQIPDHANCANMLKKIYSQYEGYYQKDGITLYVNISDNIRADVEISIASEGRITRFSTSTAVVGAMIEGNYQDNLQQTGKFTLILDNTGINFSCTTDGAENSTQVMFELSERSDQPINTIDAKTIKGWVEKQHTLSQIIALGYELDQVEVFDRAGANRMYQIKDTDIYITVFGFWVNGDGYGDTVDDVVVAVQAPAELLHPSLIGKSDSPIIEGGLLYWPYGDPGGDGYLSFGYEPSGKTVSESTPIGLTSKQALTTKLWDELMLDIAQLSIASEVESKYKIQSAPIDVVTQNDTHVLLSAEITTDRCAWYKYDIKSQKVTFAKEGPYKADGYKISKTLWFSEYADFAREFPDLYDITPNSEQWKDIMRNIITDKAFDYTDERHSSQYAFTSSTIAENNTHMLIYVDLNNDSTLWFKGSLQDGTIVCLGEYKYYVSTQTHDISKYYWFNEHSDLAKEFPALYGDPDTVSLPYLSKKPFSVVIDDDECWIYKDPSFDNTVTDEDGWIVTLPQGTYTVIEVQPDELYRPWGKLESGEGWIYLYDYFE